jgi:hypothetical protein
MLLFYSLVEDMKLQHSCGWLASYALGLARYYILLSSLTISFFSIPFQATAGADHHYFVTISHCLLRRTHEN